MSSKQNQFFTGFNAFWKASGFLFRNKMGAWYLAPLAIWLSTFIISVISISMLIGKYLNKIIAAYFPKQVAHADSFWDTLQNIFSKGLEYLAIAVVYIFSTIFLARTAKYIVLIICSPLLAYLSEITEEKLTGRTYPFSFTQLLKDMLRGIVITLRNLFLELLLTVLGFLLSLFVPALSPLVVIVLYLVNCYFMGFSMFDYVAERKRLGVTQSVGFMKKHTWMLIGLGLSFNIVSLVPFLMWVMAPINGATGAVIALEEENKQPAQPRAGLLDA